MKKVLLKIDYTNESNKFWFESSVKNKIFEYDPEKATIHDLITQACHDEGMELSYKGKPQGNVFIDDKQGNSHIVGYLYRGQTEIDCKRAYFTVWVSIYNVTDFQYEELD
jgi:hypothetical protein